MRNLLAFVLCRSGDFADRFMSGANLKFFEAPFIAKDDVETVFVSLSAGGK